MRFAVLHIGRSAHVIAKRVLEINALLFILVVLVYNCDTHCGVKELIMFIARANAAIMQTMYQMIYPSEPNSERFNLFLCHVFAMYQRCSISASFE